MTADFYGDDLMVKEEEFAIPEDVERITMTEDIINSLVQELEVGGLEEGVDFLIDNDGCLLCTSKVNKTPLAIRGIPMKELY